MMLRLSILRILAKVDIGRGLYCVVYNSETLFLNFSIFWEDTLRDRQTKTKLRDKKMRDKQTDKADKS